jgi:sugar phosphate isomerase/epimerase
MIRYSCAEYTFPLLPRVERFKLLQLLGFKYADLGLFERSSDLRPGQLAADPKNFTRLLKSDLKSAGLAVSDVFLQIGLDPTLNAANDPSPRVRSRNRRVFTQALELCAALACKHLTGLPGVHHSDSTVADDLALASEEAAWRQRTASEAGVTYAIEAHIGSICSDVASARSLIEAVPGLSLTLDYGHFVAENIPSREVHSLLPFASHVHVRGGAPGQLQTPLADNKIDFKGMIRRLKKQDSDVFLALEYVWTDWRQCNRTDNVSETILLRRFLEDIEKKLNDLK